MTHLILKILIVSNLGNYTTSRISFVTMASSNLQDKQKKNGIVQLIRTHFSLTVTCWAQSLFIFCLQKPGTQRLHRMIRTRQKKKKKVWLMDKILNASKFLAWPPFYPCTSHLTTRVAIFNNHTLGKMMVVVLSFFF